MIEINDITVRIGSKVLLEHASAHISDGQKVGLVGANGCGKSTNFCNGWRPRPAMNLPKFTSA